jgi:hypothetical protein
MVAGIFRQWENMLQWYAGYEQRQPGGAVSVDMFLIAWQPLF